jgi:hypothetical protein
MNTNENDAVVNVQSSGMQSCYGGQSTIIRGLIHRVMKEYGGVEV